MPITPDWLIDWGYFIGGVTPRKHNADYVLPQPSYRIDTRVGNPLSILPEFKDETIRIQANLAYRNLSRGVGLGLPSGEEMASALNIKPMTPAQVWSAGSKDCREEAAKSEIHSRRKAISDHKFVAHFSEGTPLWYYVLREAEYYGCTRELPGHYLQAKGVKEDVKGSQQENINFGGQHLGPVGSRVVLETFLGMLWHDRRSFLHDATWRPHHRLNPAGEFTLGKLIHFALA